MKRLIILLILCFCSAYGIAQIVVKSQFVYGKVQEKSSKLPIAYASVQIKDQFSKLILGGLTDSAGTFKLGPVPAGRITIEISLMGYRAITKPLEFNASINLGVLFLETDAMLLKEVTITGDQPAVSLKLDKKVFLVGKDVLSQAGSSLDLLSGVPSISVSPSGGVSLRGNSSVLVLINGKRSGLSQGNALEQLPADQIERVEVITNPSSRYDAAGSAGIINIVLKKNKKSGFNGQLRLVGGIPNETRITPSINYKSDRLNLFSTFGIRLSDYVGLYTTDQSTDKGAVLLHNRQDENRHDDAKMFYFGADYMVNNHNTLTLAFLKNATNDHDKTNLNYNYTVNGTAADRLLRSGESWEKRNYNQLEFNYTKTFPNPAKKYTIDMQYDFWNSDKDWNLFTKKIFPTVGDLAGIRTSSIGASKDFMIQTDLVQPLDSSSNFEFGLKAENRKVTSSFKAEQQNGNEWNTFNGIDNELLYNELIGSAYVQFNSKLNQFAYQLGIRSELTKIGIEDRAKTYNNDKEYVKFFPTLHITYPFSTSANLQVSYSKRINRPSLNLLYPFNELTDLNAQFVGNPALNPSFADVIELGFLKNWNKLTINPSLYFQNNKGIIQDYTFRNQDDVFITTSVNIDKETRSGLELSVLYSPVKWIQLNAELNAYQFEQKGWYKEQNFAYKGEVLTSRISTQFKSKLLSLQARYNFTGAQRNAQSYTLSLHNIDFGASKNLFKDKATLLLDVTNVFNLRKFQTNTTGSDYVLSQMSSPNATRYRLTFVYRLNLKENQAVRQAKTGNRN